MSFQVKQLSSTSSSSSKEKIPSANMSDEEPQDDQELVNIAAAEKQSGTEHKEWLWGCSVCPVTLEGQSRGGTKAAYLGTKEKSMCFAKFPSFTELPCHLVLSNPCVLFKAFTFSARIEIFFFITYFCLFAACSKWEQFHFCLILNTSETSNQISNQRFCLK